MNAISGFLRSSIGRKIVMAVTGFILWGFVIGHMVGNLQIYLGREVLNAYAVFLRQFGHGGGLWVARGTLIVAALLHIWAAASLTRSNMVARPMGYRERENRESTPFSRTMRVSGVLLLAFLIYHLADFTFGGQNPDFRPHDVYHNVIASFSVPWISGIYIAAMLFLGMHLYHGVWSMMQTLGLNHPRYNNLRKTFAALITAVVVLGNISFPVAVLTGFIHE
jgi:succinate dehydrogenase / fumarate reductase cytochrome b subunit